MKKPRKQTKRLINELINLRKSRKSIDEFNFNFLLNFCENCRLMHEHLNKNFFSEDLFKIAYRQYFVFLVSCWETFFRDMFVYIHSSDEQSINDLIKKMKIDNDSIRLKNITLPELLSKSFNFQNKKDLESAYNNIWGSNFLNYVCDTKIEFCGLNGKFTKNFSVKSLFPDWRKITDKTFDIRHKVVHDANYRPKIDTNLIQKSEALFLLIPQLVTYFAAIRFKLKQLILSNGEYAVPYVFSVKDILSDDWVVVEKK